jgi:hypothetical protein
MGAFGKVTSSSWNATKLGFTNSSTVFWALVKLVKKMLSQIMMIFVKCVFEFMRYKLKRKSSAG